MVGHPGNAVAAVGIGMDRPAREGVESCRFRQFPDLCYDFSPHVAMSGRESPQWYLCHNNLLLTNLASLYEPAAVRREFELRMRRAKSLPMKLELAIVAAPAGSEAAALLLMRTMRSSDYLTWSNLHDAFTSLSFEYGEPGLPLRRRDSAALAGGTLPRDLFRQSAGHRPGENGF